jgi:uncharacterized membrane protein
MRTIRITLGLGLVLAVFGCTRSQPGGGPDKPSQFTINGPATSTSVRPGETNTVALQVSRGSDFKQDVKLKIEAPAGVTVEPSATVVKGGEKGDINLKVAVAKDVTPGEHIIHVTGTPDSGKVTTLDLKLSVPEKASSEQTMLTLRGPSTATNIKQGEAKVIKVHLEPNAKHTAGVKLQADASSGLKAEILSSATIKAADNSEAEIRVTADKNASKGEHTIRITGTTDGATVRGAEVKVNVVAP